MLLLVLSLLSSPAMGNPVPQEDPSSLPPLLTLDTFDKTTSKQLSLVEFFSPYCSHCKTFAPTWEATYNKFHQDYSDSLKIDMYQVNCVESGDLCDREQIMAYPNIRLYAPSAEQKGKPKYIGPFPRIERSEENLIKFLKEAVSEYGDASSVPSSSKLLDTDTILNLVAGAKESAQFVAFYPATDKGFGSNCVGCVDSASLWDRLSTRIASTIDTGHFNCLDNPKVCSSLGLEDLTNPKKKATAKYIMFLPKSAGIIQVNYDGEIDINDMKRWAVKLSENSKYEPVSMRVLGSYMKLPQKLQPGKIDYNNDNAVSVVFYYDESTVVPEDKSVLTHLLLSLQKSPFNIHLYISKHKQLEERVKDMNQALIKYLNYDNKAQPYKFNKALEIATTLTAKPTILVFKDNSLLVDIYQTYAPEDTRIFERVDEFIQKVQFPTFEELTIDLLSTYFTRRSKQDYKVVIAFVDSTTDITPQLDNLNLAAHEYQYLKKEYYFNKLESDRQRKQEWIDKLKSQNMDSMKIIQAMRQEIPHLWNNDDILFTYIDKSKTDDFKYISEWKLDINKYEVGDAVVLSKDSRYCWDHDVKGNKLKNDPKAMKHVLLSFLENSNAGSKRLTGSPYIQQLQFMDNIHDYGIFGYIALFALLYLLVWIMRGLKKRRRARSSGNNGLLGTADVPKKD
ncbi:ER-retained PMA1-suppressing protein 1 [Spathaspora sp. JA1]|nr:ER-retained PMA1-suppressing protein 1 [Spathaspora sp. JA1]